MTTAMHRLDVEVRVERRELVTAYLWAAGATGVLHTADGLAAWFHAAELDEVALARPEELAGDRQRWRVEEDRDWQADWKATIRPVVAGHTVVVPSWLADDHVAEAGIHTIVLDPGRAFGSGHHATTTLCLELLEAIDARTEAASPGRLEGRHVSDVGCGTGVLGIAAALRGARVTAVDVDPVAVAVTRENAARNDVRLTAHTGSVEHLAGTAEVVVANLVTDVVLALGERLVAASSDELVVSGISTGRAEQAIAALENLGTRLVDQRERDGWIAARLRRTGAPR